MAELVVCRGLPGCGKTTHAKAEIVRRPRGSVCRINRDDYRRYVFNTTYRRFEGEEIDPLEDLITVLQHAAIRTALTAGIDVICDDTNLYSEHVVCLMRLAVECGAGWRIQDFTHVPLETCIDRDALRFEAGHVGEAVIRAMYDWHSPNGWAPMPIPAFITEEVSA